MRGWCEGGYDPWYERCEGGYEGGYGPWYERDTNVDHNLKAGIIAGAVHANMQYIQRMPIHVDHAHTYNIQYISTRDFSHVPSHFQAYSDRSSASPAPRHPTPREAAMREWVE